MEITKEQIEKFNNSDDISSKWELTSSILSRGFKQLELEKIIDKGLIDTVATHVKVCSEEKYKENYINGLNRGEKVSDFEIPMAFLDSKTNNIYIKRDTKIEVILHEIIHYLSNQKQSGNGMINKLSGYCNGSEELKKLQSDSFNEAMTHFITQLLVPEIKVSDGYNYGANIMEKYYNMLKDCGIDSSLLFQAYFTDDSKSVEKIVSDFGNDWTNILNSIYLQRFMYIFKNQTSNALNDEQIDGILNGIKSKKSIENSQNLTKYVEKRNEYSKEESLMLSSKTKEESEVKTR